MYVGGSRPPHRPRDGVASLVVLDLDLGRVDSGPGEPLGWGGSALSLLAPGGDIPATVVWRERAGGENLRLELVRVLGAAQQAAAELRDFRAAPLPEFRLCDFQRACGAVRLVRRPEQDRSDWLEVTTPDGLIALAVERAEEFQRTPSWNDPRWNPEDLMLVSVTTHPLPGRDVLVVNLGAGDDRLAVSARRCGRRASAPP